MPSTAPLPTRDYPWAERLDLVERLPEAQPTYDVADPYRWLEDDAAEATQAWTAAQDELFAEHRERWNGREHLRTRVTELLGAGVVSAPAWRGERQFVIRRTAGQEHALLLVVDA